MVITSKIEGGVFEINFDNITHISFRTNKYIGYQTWIDKELSKYFTIELYLQEKTLLLQYSTLKKLKAVTKCLNKIKY